MSMEEYRAAHKAGQKDYRAHVARGGDASNYYMAVVTALEQLLGKDCERISLVKQKMCFEPSASQQRML